MNTAIGSLASADGIAYDPAQRRPAWSSRSSDYSSVQPATIAVDRDHDGRWIGRVVYLERHQGVLWAVAEVDAEPTVAIKVGDDVVHVLTNLFFSAERVAVDDEDIVLRSVAITRTPARLGARPLTWFAGDLGDRGMWLLNRRRLGGHLGELVERAAESRYTGFFRSSTVIHDTEPAGGLSPIAAPGDAPTPGLLYRSAETLDITVSERRLELIVMPYESETLVGHQGRVIAEVIGRGAFDGIERQPGRVPVNRDHNVERVIGKAIAFHPSRREGLVAEVKIANTSLGDESLQLAAEGILDCSAAFGVRAERWENNGQRRRVTAATLAHIALTPDPAYPDARILSVH
jgi:HK97 family phage prohead protease